jgi:hypothetical protein
MGRKMQRESHGDESAHDATQESFWNEMAERLREATVFGKAQDCEDDVDFEFDYEPDPEYEKRERALKTKTNSHPLTQLADTYRKKAHKWLQSSDDDLKAVAEDMLQAAGASFDQADYEEQARQIGEMLEVIAWYHTLLFPKTARAVRSYLEHKNGEEGGILAESHREDANGSGKLVLASIERSMAAWVKMRKILPHREDEIIEMLAILKRLHRGISTALPDAKSFMRPGLDEKQL